VLAWAIGLFRTEPITNKWIEGAGGRGLRLLANVKDIRRSCQVLVAIRGRRSEPRKVNGDLAKVAGKDERRSSQTELPIP
jgi:hypothetical protein